MCFFESYFDWVSITIKSTKKKKLIYLDKHIVHNTVDVFSSIDLQFVTQLELGVIISIQILQILSNAKDLC